MRRWLVGIVGIAATVAVAYALVGGRSPSSGAARNAVPGVPVTVAQVQQKPMPEQLSAIGRVQTINSVAVRSRLDGVIASVPVNDGQEIKAGDILFTLDDRALKAAVAQAEGVLARDRAQLANARAEVERYRPLLGQEYVSRQKFEGLEANAKALEGTVKSDEATLDGVKVLLSYATIRAPIDGRLGSIGSKVGNAIRANDTNALVTLNQMKPIYVGFSVQQERLDEIRKAMAAGPVSVLVAEQDHPDAALAQGKLSYIENTVDAQSNTLTVKAAFDNPSETLWPGSFVNVTLTLGMQSDAVVVPAEAVQAGQKSPFVFLLKPDQTVEARPVEVDRAIGDETVIARGVLPGDKVVTDGQLRLDNGTRVTVRDTARAPNRQSAAKPEHAP